MTPPAQGSGLQDLVGRDLGTHVTRYEEPDAILYALAVGASAEEIELVYEERLEVLPTFALTFGLWALDAAAVAGAYDRRDTLHVGQDLVVHRPLGRRAEIEMAASIAEVWDKGSAALISVLVASDFFDASYTIFIRGAGGFGGARGASGAPEMPQCEPDVRTQASTTSDQAALYRLTGDLQPIHIDPSVARAAGFDRPILHGLGTLGCVTLALTRVFDHQPRVLDRALGTLCRARVPRREARHLVLEGGPQRRVHRDRRGKRGTHSRTRALRPVWLT